jgi:hypothetical protein
MIITFIYKYDLAKTYTGLPVHHKALLYEDSMSPIRDMVRQYGNVKYGLYRIYITKYRIFMQMAETTTETKTSIFPYLSFSKCSCNEWRYHKTFTFITESIHTELQKYEYKMTDSLA